ncbi:hypothetical protein QBC41DRAFT_372665 [Cercophora samala]|uniref:Protein kinase domain-containing protein n=1 Tax=Cercophora samala TaxID=330535 RepID=A0AA39ZGM0_9PEZI|nr:hypothetical protein QBC41DRAFT_372665 [Cercophora samala]
METSLPSTTTQSYSRVRSSRCGHTSLITSSKDALALEEVIDLLASSDLMGPALVPEYGKYIGQGAQFHVQTGDLHWAGPNQMYGRTVAVKYPKFDLNPNGMIDLGGDQARQHLDHIRLEVEALTKPALRNHPNIARLLSWSLTYSIHRPIALVMELAYGDLEQTLSRPTPTWLRYMLCSDIANGLDAIHSCKLVHGDLKPSNILVFGRRKRLVAALADFGLSAEHSLKDQSGVRLGGTPGWQAPEVVEGRLLRAEQLYKADNFSFGLVLWYAMLMERSPPSPCPPDMTLESWIDIRVTQSRKWLRRSREVGCITKPLLLSLLNPLVDCRPRLLGPLFVHRKSQKSPRSRHDRGGNADFPTSFDIPMPWGYHQKLWFEIPTLTGDLAPDLARRMTESPENATPHALFALFLDLLMPQSPELPPEYRHSPLKLLKASLEGGYSPAKAVAPVIFEYFQQTKPDVKNCFSDWLSEGVSTGSVYARPLLAKLDPGALASALQTFERAGGYSQFYFTNSGCSQLHWLCIYGTLQELEHHFRAFPEANIEESTSDSETPLYLACTRGAWDIVLFLLDHGADASVISTRFRVSCLHWIFAFPDAVQERAAQRLVESGANINAVSRLPLPFFHYPFVLPAGTPLHWAVVLSNQQAISTLIGLGADPTIRDLSDAYMFDQRVRDQYIHGGPHMESYSSPSEKPDGLSPLDYAAMDYNPFIFEYLVERQQRVDINTADGDGFTVFHRLTASPIRRTLTHNRFSFLPFLGRFEETSQRLRRTISAIKALGGDINRLTTPECYSKDHCATHNQRPIQPFGLRPGCFPSYTPLMLATKNALSHIVSALLAAGASPSVENQMGDTALDLVSTHDEQARIFLDGEAAKVTRLLISAGAQAGHRNKLGKSALINAAQIRCLDTMDILLSCGADIDEADIQTWTERSILSLLAKSPAHPSYHDRDIETDGKLAEFLERHVLHCPDPEKRLRAMQVGNLNIETPLHEYAYHVCPLSVKMALRCGADVNQPFVKERGSTENGSWVVRERWEETPLDAVVEARRMARKRVGNVLGLDRYHQFLALADEVTRILKEAGGVYALHKEESSEGKS